MLTADIGPNIITCIVIFFFAAELFPGSYPVGKNA